MERQTTLAKTGHVEQAWHLVDAEGKVLGRLASDIATILMGKHKPIYTPHVDTGDFVVVINAEKMVLTGRKAEQKFLKSYTRYPGGLKQRPYGELLTKRPQLLLEKAVQRMLPKNDLARHMLSKLKVYAGAEHPHQAQQPAALEL